MIGGDPDEQGDNDYSDIKTTPAEIAQALREGKEQVNVPISASNSRSRHQRAAVRAADERTVRRRAAAS